MSAPPVDGMPLSLPFRDGDRSHQLGRSTAVLPLIGGVLALLEAGSALYLLDARRRGVVAAAEVSAGEHDDVP